jgi:hypothetical protein
LASGDNLLDILSSENISRAADMLRRFSDKRQIVVKDKRESGVPGTYLAFVTEEGGRIVIYCDMSLSESVREVIVVHEILHKILNYEGYPQVTIDKTAWALLPPEVQDLLIRKNGLRDRFQSAIDHPEIFRRIISGFELDIDSYFDIQVSQKLRMFQSDSSRRLSGGADYYFREQQNIMWGIELFWYPTAHRNRILFAFEESHPDSYHSCLSLYEKIKGIGFGSPDAAYKCVSAVKSHIAEYGKSRNTGRYERMWEALEIRKTEAQGRTTIQSNWT